MKIILFDMGLPMIFPSIVLMAVGLIPIIVIEAYVMEATLKLGFKRLFAPVTIANVVSTVVGIPLTWVLLALLEFASVVVFGVTTGRNPWSDLFSLTLGAPWVAPGHHNEEWIILGAMLFLLVPYCLASWAIEYLVIKKILTKKQDAAYVTAPLKDLQFAVGKANLTSYCLLALFVIAFWGMPLFRLAN
ncbi:MAG: hypothetical protein ABIV21_08620 [Pyrinomonadaceae bacterium]